MQKDWEIHWEDYYEILQVHPSAELEVIKAAYQKLAQKYHPDVNKNPAAAERMKKINVAYEALSDPEKRRQYDSEWFRKGSINGKSALPKPKPVVDPGYIHFKDVGPGETQTASFVIRNTGGPYAKMLVMNPDSWVRIVRGFSLTDSDELPVQVEIEAEGDDWDKNYSEIIRVRLDEEETQVKVELQTKPAPVREKAKVGARPSTGSTYSPPASPPVSPKNGMPAWGKWFIGLAVLGIILGAISQFKPSNTPPKTAVPIPGRIVFVSDRNGNNEIYLIGPDSSQQINLTNNSANDWDPNFSPDGRKIAFVSDRDGGNKIYIMGANGNNAMELTEGEDPAWFPDGSKIIFSRVVPLSVTYNPPDWLHRIFIINVDGTGEREVNVDIGALKKLFVNVEFAHFREPTIAPDGKRFAFIGLDLFVIDINGENPYLLAGGALFLLNNTAAWSLNGNVIAYDTNRKEIHIRDAATGKDLAAVIQGQNPTWSPDGKKIAFVEEKDREIYISDLKSGAIYKITSGAKINLKGPLGSPFYSPIQALSWGP